MSQKKAKQERKEKGKTDCSKCEVKGICCAIIVELVQSGLNFRSKEPAFICEKLDISTGECKDYENRPDQCKNFDCNGKPRPMRIKIEGVNSGLEQKTNKGKQNSKKILR